MEGGLLTPLYQGVLSISDATPIKPVDGWREYFQQCPHGKYIYKSTACCWRIALPTLSWCAYVVLSIPTAMPIKPVDGWREYFQQCPQGRILSKSASLGGLLTTLYHDVFTWSCPYQLPRQLIQLMDDCNISNSVHTGRIILTVRV